MLLKTEDIKSSEITDESTYLNRRNFVRGGILAGRRCDWIAYRKLNSPGAGQPRCPNAGGP
jgi:hypothetical protein